jgi:hypothetical protein
MYRREPGGAPIFPKDFLPHALIVPLKLFIQIFCICFLQKFRTLFAILLRAGNLFPLAAKG